jgi:hypothetical protein
MRVIPSITGSSEGVTNAKATRRWGREGQEVQRHDSGLKNEEDKGGKQSFLSGDYSLLEKEGKREREMILLSKKGNP